MSFRDSEIRLIDWNLGFGLIFIGLLGCTTILAGRRLVVLCSCIFMFPFHYRQQTWFTGRSCFQSCLSDVTTTTRQSQVTWGSPSTTWTCPNLFTWDPLPPENPYHMDMDKLVHPGHFLSSPQSPPQTSIGKWAVGLQLKGFLVV